MALKSKQNKLDENEAPLQVEMVTEETTSTDVAVVEQTGSIQNFNVDDALAQWEAYQIFTEKLLDKSDYIDIKGKAFKKKSAWRKYARAFNINTEIISKDIIKNDKGIVTEAEFIVRATLPDCIHCDGWGNCSRREGNKNKPNHDIPATAMTRATNRAIADLIGAGEVTAEEIR